MEELISVQFNGKKLDVPKGASIADLLVQAEMRNQLVAVEVNLEIVPLEQHESHVVSDGDSIEAVTLVGGG